MRCKLTNIQGLSKTCFLAHLHYVRLQQNFSLFFFLSFFHLWQFNMLTHKAISKKSLWNFYHQQYAECCVLIRQDGPNSVWPYRRWSRAELQEGGGACPVGRREPRLDSMSSRSQGRPCSHWLCFTYHVTYL